MPLRQGDLVIDLSVDLAGLYAGRLLARQGFDVIRVQIDDPVAVGSIILDGPAAAEGSPYRAYLDQGVRKVTVCLPEISDLVADADVVLSTFGPNVAQIVGVDPSGFRDRNRTGTLVSVTPFGLTGPRAGCAATEQSVMALAGLTLISGRPDGVPMSPKLPIPSVLGGIYAAIAVLLDRLSAQPAANAVDLALMEIMAANTERVLSWYSYLEAVPFRGAGSGRLEQSSGGGFLQAADGFFYIFSGYQWFNKVADLVGKPELIDTESQESATRKLRASETDRIVADAVAGLSQAELTRRAQELRMPSGPVNTVGSLLHDVQFRERGVFTETTPGTLDIEEPYRMISGPPKVTPVPKASRPFGVGDLPLTGVRVLDLSHAFAGPTSSRILGEAGADVLKIESVERLDLLARGMLLYDNDTTGDWWDRSAYFGERNLGKRSLALDMASDAGRDIFLRLLADTDVVVANFTPRVLRGWGLDPETLIAANPRVIVLMMTGFGMTGPKADNPALAGTMEAASGFSSLARVSDDEPPGALGMNFGDMVSGVYGAVAVLFALDRRRRTNSGQIIDFACAEAPIPFLAAHLLHHHASGRDVSCSFDPFNAGSHVLIEAEDGPPGQRWVLTYVPPGREGSVRERDAGLGLQTSRRGSGLCSTLSRVKLLEALELRSLLAVPLHDAEDLWFDDHLRQRETFSFATRASMPTLPHARSIPGQWNGAPLRADMRSIPTLGDANWAILGEELGMSAERFARLELDGTTGSRPRGRLPRTFQVPLALEDLESKGLIRRVDGARSKLVDSFDPRHDDHA